MGLKVSYFEGLLFCNFKGIAIDKEVMRVIAVGYSVCGVDGCVLMNVI